MPYGNPWGLGAPLAGPPTEQEHESELLGAALKRRYGNAEWPGLPERMMDDMGMRKQRLKLRLEPGMLTQDKVLGTFTPETGRTRIATDMSNNAMDATLAHELAHMADHVFQTPAVNQGSQQTRLHHSNFANFEPEMAKSIDEQQAIELGLPPNPALLGKYPWLRKVKKNSSNRLASPWSGAKEELPADIYNATREP